MHDAPLIFLGDSLTMRHNWSAFKAANMGIDGDTTRGVLSRLSQTKNADTIVLMIGVNDILNQSPLISLQKNYMKILDSFEAHQRIYLLSLLPVIDDKQTKQINQQIRTINRWLKEQSQKRKMGFINLYPSFLDAQQKGLDKSLTTDGIHLTPKAYALWERLLRDVLSEK